MATYREIKGTDVAYESSAPGSPTDAGHVWFLIEQHWLQVLI